jgi:hypothetical protein
MCHQQRAVMDQMIYLSCKVPSSMRADLQLQGAIAQGYSSFDVF